jgi:hypothetical protein
MLSSAEETRTRADVPAGGAALADASGLKRRHEPSWLEVGSGVAILLVWALVFAIGVVFPSARYRERLLNEQYAPGSAETFGNLVLFLMSYTASNVAILACLAAWLGELGCRTRIDGTADGRVYHRGDYTAAVVRGFLAYLAVLSGFVLVGSGVRVFVQPSPEEYIRMAAVGSLLGFIVGFRPGLFRRFEEQFERRVNSRTEPDGTTRTEVREVTRLGPGAVRPNGEPTGLLGGGPARDDGRPRPTTEPAEATPEDVPGPTVSV